MEIFEGSDAPVPTAVAKVGERVLYVPDVIHATKPGPSGAYPFVVGKKIQRPKVVRGQVDMQTSVEELTHGETVDFFDQISKSPNPRQALDAVQFLRLNEAWPAVVRKTREDGSCDLDVTSNNGGVTLHYDRVPFDQTGTIHHTFHLPPGTAVG